MMDEAEKQKMKDFINMGTGFSIDSIESALRDCGLHVYNFEIKNSYGEVPKVTIDCFHAKDAQKGNVSKKVTPKNIFKNGLYTTVLWADGTKTIVKRGEDEPDDEYSAFTAALARKIYGTNSAVKRIVRMTEVQSKKYKEPKDNPANPFSAVADAIVNSVANVTKTMRKPKDACPIDKPCEETLNDKAKKQYKEYLNADKWTCPECGRQYQWQYNNEGRYAFCQKCQLAVKEGEKA